VAAGKRNIFFVADEKDREGSCGHGFFRGDFGGVESRKRFPAIEKRPTERREERFSEERRPAQPGVIVGSFAKTCKGRFGDDCFDARIGRGGVGIVVSSICVCPPSTEVTISPPPLLKRNQ
jgi:hypothetical protein